MKVLCNKFISFYLLCDYIILSCIFLYLNLIQISQKTSLTYSNYLRRCRAIFCAKLRHTGNVENETYSSNVWHVTLIVRVGRVSWPVNKRNSLPCPVRQRQFNQRVGCLLDVNLLNIIQQALQYCTSLQKNDALGVS